MKKIKLFRNIADYIVNNRMKYIFACICLVFGVVIGSLLAVFSSCEQYNALGNYMNNFVSAHILQPISRNSVFCFSVYNNFKIVLFMWISGFGIALIPLGVLQLVAKGYKIGFTTAFLAQLYGFKGILLSFISIIPQLLFFIPMLISYAVFNFNFAFELRNIRRHGQSFFSNKELCLKNLAFLCLTVFVFIISSLIDTFIIPIILKPVCLFII